nr:putative lipid-transfer protein DIR1 [Ipomoea trifida]
MEACRKTGAILALLLLMVATAAAAGGGRLANDEDNSICGLSVEELMTCKEAVTAGSHNNPPSPPSTTCCAALSKAKLPCLCNFKNNDVLIKTFKINPALAVALPAKCGLPPPPCAAEDRGTELPHDEELLPPAEDRHLSFHTSTKPDRSELTPSNFLSMKKFD